MIRKSVFLIVIIVFFVYGLAFSAQHKISQTIKMAKAEGQVDWSSTIREKETQKFIKAFEKEYPGIKVNYVRAHGGQAMERLMREVQTGTQTFDVVQIHNDYVQIFLKMEAMQRLDLGGYNVVPQFLMRDSHFLGTFMLGYVFVYNSNLVKKEEAPKTWNDFLDPKWKGKFVVDSRPSAFTFLVSTWGKEKVLDYAEKLRKNNPIFVRGQTKAITLMAAGDHMMSATGYISSAVHVVKKGGPIAWNVPDVIPLQLTYFGILKNAKHPNASKLFLGWLGSKGYKIMDGVNWGRSAPYGGTRTEKEFAGKTLSFPPTDEQIPDRQAFVKQVLGKLGVKAKKKKKK
jgi:iron(III) transport system substrate-binding protein